MKNAQIIWLLVLRFKTLEAHFSQKIVVVGRDTSLVCEHHQHNQTNQYKYLSGTQKSMWQLTQSQQILTCGVRYTCARAWEEQEHDV